MAGAVRRLIKYLRIGGSAALLAALHACTASSPSTVRNVHAAPAAVPSGPAVDASYDWHALLLAPFGMLLKESPVALHEVLLFRDSALPQGGADIESKDCYAVDGTPPRFVGRQPDPYLLCFGHDHLNRVEATVRLPGDEAQQIFARACALWLHGTAPSAAGSTCEGREGRIAFSAHLGATAENATLPLSITLSSPTERDAP